MKLKVVALAVASTVVGFIGGTFLHSQTAVPPADVIAEVQVTDPDTFKQYLVALPGTMAPHRVSHTRPQQCSATTVDRSTSPAGKPGGAGVQQYGRSPGVVEFIGVPSHHSVAREIRENVVTVIALVVATGISYAQKATTKDQLFGT